MKKLSNKVFFNKLAAAMGKTYQFVDDIEKIFKKMGVYYDYDAVMYRADLDGLSLFLSISQPKEPRDSYYGILLVKIEKDAPAPLRITDAKKKFKDSIFFS